MRRWFNLWDAEDNNLVGSFPTRAEALAVVRYSLAKFGQSSIETLMLTAEDERQGPLTVIAEGDDLACLARTSVPVFSGNARLEVEEESLVGRINGARPVGKLGRAQVGGTTLGGSYSTISAQIAVGVIS